MPEHLPLSCPSWHPVLHSSPFRLLYLATSLSWHVPSHTISTDLPSFHGQGLSPSFISSSYSLKVVLLAWSFVIQHYLRNSKYHDFYRHRISSCPEGMLILHCVSRACRSLLLHMQKERNLRLHSQFHYRRITGPFLKFIRNVLGSNANDVLSDHIRFHFPPLFPPAFQPTANIHSGMSAPFVLLYELCSPLEFLLHRIPCSKRKDRSLPPFSSSYITLKSKHPLSTLAWCSGIDKIWK